MISFILLKEFCYFKKEKFMNIYKCDYLKFEYGNFNGFIYNICR